MKKMMRFLERSLQWLESDGVASFLAKPLQCVPYGGQAGGRGVVLVIDVSPSMEAADYQPTRLEGAKRATRRYVDTLAHHEPGTLVGIVDFHGEAELVSPPLPVGTHHGELLKSLDALHTGFGTNIGDGLQMGGRELARIPSPDHARIILLTDGDSNLGPDPVETAKHLKARGVQIDIIGIGGSPADVNEKDLKRMASVVNDQLHYWFIESVDELVERFEALALREIR